MKISAKVFSLVIAPLCITFAQSPDSKVPSPPQAADNKVQGPQWEKKELKDPFRGFAYTEFRLEGKYLRAPQDDNGTPAMILRCVAQPSGHRSGYKYDGKLLEAFLYVGQTVVDAQVGSSGSSKVQVDYRLDDGKIQTYYLYHSTNFKAVSLKPPFCGECAVNNFFYGHELSHKEGTNPQIKKVILSIPEFQGGDVVIQFDLPDVTEVAKICGVTRH